MWKIYYKDKIGGQNPDFWAKNFRDLDVGYAKEKAKEDYLSEIFLKFFPKQGKILDGGCGLGQHVLAYRDLGYEIEGLDFSEELIEAIVKFDSKAPCRKGNILQIGAPAHSYECYYSLGVFEHFEEGPAAAIREAMRILNSNGLFILAVPFENLFRKTKFNILNFLGKLGKRSYVGTNLGFIKKVNKYCKQNAPENNIKFHEYICGEKEIIGTLESSGFKIEYSTPCSIIWGILDLPYMKKIYRVIEKGLQGKNKSYGHKEKLEGKRKRSLVKDIIIYEKRNSLLKSLFVLFFGLLFGNLFLVVCRKKE